MSASALKDKKVKLTYFDLGGRALPIRYALAIGGIPFEDNRVKIQDWPQLKPNTPYGELPVIEVREPSASLLRIGKVNAKKKKDFLWPFALCATNDLWRLRLKRLMSLCSAWSREKLQDFRG